MHSVFRRLEGRRGTRGIDLVALPDVGENLLIVRRTHVTLLVLLDTTGCTLLRACREYQPAVPRLCHAEMFQFHAVSLLLSGS